VKINSVRFVRSGVKKDHYPPPICPEVAVFGRSNAGKSSLINSLVGRHNLAETSRRPGRTKVINFYLVNESLYLTDLPGYGYAKVPEEVRQSWSQMVDCYLRERENLRFLLFLADIRRDLGVEELDWCQRFDELSLPFVLVLTKADACKVQERFRRLREMEGLKRKHLMAIVDFSIREGAGKKALWAIISKIFS